MTLDQVKVTLVDDVDAAWEFTRWLSTKTEVAFDTETTGLDVITDRVRLVQYGDEDRAWVVPFERWSGLVHDVTRRYEGTYDMWNAPYDVEICRSNGIELPTERVTDGRLMLHVLESTGSLALKNYSKREIDPRADWGQDKLSEALGSRGGWTWETIPYDFEAYWFYAGLDTILTKRAKSQLWPRVRAEAPRSYDLELAVAWVAAKMQRNGVRVDREYTEEFRNSLIEFTSEAERWCQATFDVYPGSDVKVAQKLTDLGVELTRRTPSGDRYSVDKSVLSGIDHPLAQTVLARRQAVKLVSTYLDHFLELSARDGRIHPSINTVGGVGKNPFESGGAGGVRTGRMSMSGPNLQNVPIRTKEGKRVRDCFVADLGHTWVKVDFDQIESRIMAHLTQDPGMIAAFASEDDFFVNLARDLYNDPNFEKSDDRRPIVKNGVYALMYGGGTDRFSKTAGVSFDEAFTFMRRFESLYPDVPTWIRRVERLGQDRLDAEGVAYVRSPLTGRRHVADPGRLYTLVNYLIQGTAGEILKLKMIEADQAGLSDFMTLPVHDEVDSDVPNDRLDDFVTTLRDVMNDSALLSVPVTASVEVGDRWGSVRDYDQVRSAA